MPGSLTEKVCNDSTRLQFTDTKRDTYVIFGSSFLVINCCGDTENVRCIQHHLYLQGYFRITAAMSAFSVWPLDDLYSKCNPVD